MSNSLNRLARALKLNLFWDKLVGHGLYEHAKRNPKILQHLNQQQENEKVNFLTQLPFAKGSAFKVHGSATIEYPRGLELGNNVHIAEHVYLECRGGVSIGDNTHISRNVSIVSSFPRYEGDALPFDNQRIDRPVRIGRNVWVDQNVSIAAGISIGDGAVIRIGAVITEDVPPKSIVEAPACRITAQRNHDRYAQLESNQSWAGHGGNLLTQKCKENFFKTAETLGENMFFVLGTGRSGSTAIAKTLSTHKKILCHHEPRLSLVSQSTRYAHGELSEKQITEYLHNLYCNQPVFPDLIYGESDQKLSNLTPLLHQLLPKAKFIWLLRNPVDTINSTYSRGWFSDADLYPTEIHDDDHSANYKPLYSQYRVHADKLGVMSTEEWKGMSAFARNCWYWGYWNQQIEKQFKLLPSNQKMIVRLEELSETVTDIINFLGADNKQSIQTQKANKAAYRLSTQNDWTENMRYEFKAFCEENYKRWYT